MFSFGSDPEIFMTKDGKIVNAIGILPSKQKKKNKGMTSVYYDNALAEMQIEPSDNASNTIENIRKAFNLLHKVAPKNKIEIKSAHFFTDEEVSDKESKTIGCIPEYCAYTLKQIMPPTDVIRNSGLRTAGGHIHLGNNDLFIDGSSIIKTIRMLDLFLGIPSILLDHDNTQKQRRKIYGHAGSHRVPNHGLEYRCLGNFWLKSPKLVDIIYDLTSFVVNFVESNGYKKFWNCNGNFNQLSLCFGYDVKLLRKCINTCDNDMAKKFMEIVAKYIPKSITKKIERISSIDFDFYKEWNLKPMSLS